MLNEQTARNSSVGDGSTTAFSFTFKVLTKNDIEVLVDGATKTVDTDYTVTGMGVSGGGTVTFGTAPADEAIVTLLRKQAPSQSSDYIAGQSFAAEAVEKDLDELTMMIQQDRETLARCIRAKKEDSLDMVLPATAGLKGKVLGFNSSTGLPEAVEPSDASSTSVTAIGSTTSRTLANRFSDFGNVKDHEAVGNGVADDSSEVKAAWTAADGGPMILPQATGYVFSGRFDSTSGDIGLSPLLPGFMGRFYHYYEPQYDLASDLLSVMHYFKSGSITIPALKQHNVMRFDGTITNGNKFKGVDWQYTVTDTTDAYCAIGLLINQGSGSTKALYGRAQASTGCTGVVVGLVSGCTVDSGVVPSSAMGVQISMDGAGSATEHSAIRIDTAEASNVIDYGVLSLGKVGYSNAFIKGFRRSGAGGNAFEWTDQTTSRDLFVIDENGNVAIGAVADPQKTIALANGNRLFTLQAQTSGDQFRITAGSVGDILKVGCVANNLADCSLSVWGNNTASGQASLQVSLGAADSGGAGYRCMRVVN